MTSYDVQTQAAIDQHSQQADQFARRYEKGSDSPFQDCFRYSRWRLNALLERYIPADGTGLRLLDVGCGTGHHVAEFRSRGFEVAGVDGSVDMLTHARRLNPEADIRESSVDRLPFADGTFDFVLCIEVLRYLPKISSCVREMGRVLKPGGVCLATATPVLNLNGYWLVNRAANLLPFGSLVRLRQYFTTPGRVRREFERAGFEAADIHGVYFGPVNWIERLVPGLIPGFLRRWKHIDAVTADRRGLRGFSNMLLVHARR